MSAYNFSRQSEKVLAFLEKEAENIARETGFVERKSKLSGRILAQTLIVGWLANPDAPLNELVQWSARLGLDISESGLHQRLNKGAVNFLECLLRRSIEGLQDEQAGLGAVLSAFDRVAVLDSSQITLPAVLAEVFAGSGRPGAKAALKLQLSYEYRQGRLNAIEVQAGRTPDQNCDLAVRYAVPNSLHLFDLGYFKVSTFEALQAANAYFVTRLQSQTALYAGQNDKQALDILSVLATQDVSQGELGLFMGRGAHLPIRLIFQKLPGPVVEARRRKARAKARQRGQTCSQRSLALLEFSLFITNVPPKRLSPEQVLQLYHLRWHIELIFKLWKGQTHLDHIHAYRPERILCQFFARLLGLVLFHAFIAPWRFAGPVELSLPKAFRILRAYTATLTLAFSNHCSAHLALVLSNMVNDFLRFAPASSRKKSPSTFRRLLALGLA